MKAHVAMFSLPIPSQVHPTLSTVATLIRRGYRVTYVTSERFAAEVSLLGAEALRCPRIESPFDQDDNEAMPIEHQYVRHVLTLAARTIPLTLPFFQKNRPDLIVYESNAFAGLLVADNLGVPAIRMSNQFDYNKQALESGGLPSAWKEEQLELDARVAQLFASYGSRKSAILDNKEPTFYFYLSDLQLRGSTATSDVFYAARCVAERPNVARWRMQGRRKGPLALVSASTTYKQDAQYYKRCLAELSRAGVHTIVSVPSNINPAEFDSLPPNCSPVQNIPLTAIMPHVDLLICGAGMATAMESAYHGVPMLMLSSGHSELEGYAQKYQDYGMGIHLTQAVAAADNVAQCAVRMLNDSELRHRVNRVQDAVKRSPGGEDLCNWLEEHLKPARH